MSETDGARKKIKELEAMVAEVVPETPDTVTLVLFTGNDQLTYSPGHFCTIDPHQFGALERFTSYLEDQKQKKEPPRAYSLSSAPFEKYVAITVKEERYVSGTTKYPPLLSPLLVKNSHPGMRLTITGFTGPYTLPADIESRTEHLVHLVAGSGMVPNFAMVKDALYRGLKLRHTFVASNRTLADVAFRRALEALEREHPGRLTVVHTLTREKNEAVFGPRVRRGRLSEELLRELIPDPSACVVYACGPAVGPHEQKAAREQNTEPPPRFMEHVQTLLEKIGVPKNRVKRESYG